MDVLSASWRDNKIAWYENDGNQNFTPHTITTSAQKAVSVYAIDVDGDGDMDVLSASNDDNKIAWYENMLISSVTGPKDPSLEKFILSQNYPNPFNPSTMIKYSIPELSYVTIKVYDVLGNEIATLVNEEKSIGSYEVEFNISSLQGSVSAKGGYASGVYFYQLKAGDYVETKKMLLLK